MAGTDEDPFAPPAKKLPHEIGEPLDAVSVQELGERIVLLRAEIDRLEEALKAKQASKQAAEYRSAAQKESEALLSRARREAEQIVASARTQAMRVKA